MAIELSVFSVETGLGASVETIPPGDSGSFEDHSVQPPRLLHFTCHPDNGGGAVYSIDPHGDVLDVRTHMMTHASLVNDGSRIHEIPLNGEWELPIQLGRGASAGATVQLIIEHTDEY